MKMEKKAVSGLMLTLLLIGMSVLAFNIQQVKASAAVSPYIAVVPESTVDPALTPGMNYTISIYTDYNGSDVWGYEFLLTFNPYVLEGIEVVNGDLITEDVGTTMWLPGTFNNTAGTLSLTGNGFFAMPGEVPVTCGPGIMANVTFSVVGYGDSYISLGDATRLIGYNVMTQEPHNIIDIYSPDTGHILSGYFANQLEVIHDIAVVSVTPSTNEVEQGELLNVTVVVENDGTVIEYVTVEVYRDYEPGLTFWLIGERSVNLAAGATKSLVFVWDTTYVSLGEHSLTAVAIGLPGEDDVADNMLESDEVVEVMHACIFEVVWESQAFHVVIESSSTVSDFAFNQSNKLICFNVSGPSGITCFCNVTIPKQLLNGEPWMIKVDGILVPFVENENETHTFLYFTYTHSIKELEIVGTHVIPEFSSAIILPLFTFFTLIAVALAKKIRRKVVAKTL